MSRTIMVTGGAGFIGGALIRHIMETTEWRVVNVDALTYAGNLESLETVQESPRYTFEQLDIRNAEGLRAAFERHRPEAVMHLAAESHVDRSIDGPLAFVETNVLGTCTLLAEARRYWRDLPDHVRDSFRFVNISTDEVFGSLGGTGRFNEESPYDPNSPYAASKAAADHFARVWQRVYGLPAIITNCSNNYGPYQFPEKLIPHMILCALEGRDLPIYGDGRQVRDWLYVEDHVLALMTVLERGRVGETYAIGGYAEMENLHIVGLLCEVLDELQTRADGRSYGTQVKHVEDRRAHDRRYAIDARKIREELGWAPAVSFDVGLRRTVEWYLANEPWWSAIREGTYRGERLGVVA